MYIMAGNEKQFDINKSNQRPDVLRAKDIIPGARPTGKVESNGAVDIPQFDLAQDIMAEHRRLIASRRRSPSSIIERVPGIENRESSLPPKGRVEASVEHRVPSIEFTSQWDPIIADIVTRDIEQLCKGTSWS
jgi:hypothetical protein